jgi:hypothetical protein
MSVEPGVQARPALEEGPRGLFWETWYSGGRVVLGTETVCTPVFVVSKIASAHDSYICPHEIGELTPSRRYPGVAAWLPASFCAIEATRLTVLTKGSR